MGFSQRDQTKHNTLLRLGMQLVKKGLSQKDQTKHNTLLRLGTQSVKRRIISPPVSKFAGVLRHHGRRL